MKRRCSFQPPKEQDGPASAEIRELVKADQADRQFTTPPPKDEWAKVAARDKERRARMRELLLADKLVTGEDFGGCFLLFQHGETPDDYLVAHDCAIIAQTLLRNLSNNAALAEDRFLVAVGRKQRFGSQFDPAVKIRPVSQGKETEVTDGLRMDYFCPSLEAARRGAMIPDEARIDRIIERVKPQMNPEWRRKMENSPESKRLRELETRLSDAKATREQIRAEVLELYRKDRFPAPAQYALAGSLLNRTWRKGENPDVLLLAHELAVVAMMRQVTEAGRTAAETIDRFLIAIRQPQRFGTAIQTVRADGKIEPPVAPTVTDAIRRKFGIAPLKELIEAAASLSEPGESAN